MTQNQSAPPGTIVPRLIYRDISKAIDWLRGAFGFTERLRTPPEPDGTIHHAQIAIGEGSLILTANPVARPDEYVPAVMVRVPNVDEHYERAKQAGARILSPPAGTMFGERQYSAEDLEGHHWAFTQSVADVQPESWGAIVTDLQRRPPRLPRPSLCYLQIPAVDPRQSAAFYERVFGWNIRHRDTSHPSFDDAAGNISGAWVTGRTPAGGPENGILPYVWVDDIDATLALVAAQGGELVEARHPDTPGGTCYIATFRDPAGNVVGLYQED